MKSSIAILAAALLGSAAARPTVATRTTSDSAPPATSGNVFTIDGEAQYIAGTDSWWMGHLTSDDDVDLAMSQIASSGLKVTRVWAFGNVNSDSTDVYYQLLTSSGATINNGTNGIGRLDSAVSSAEKYGVKLVLPMLNNWDALGGISSYTTAFGGNATSFYTDEQSQTVYKAWIEFVVNRYKSSPAIFAWELCNECRCHGCDTSVITDWANSTSQYIKSLDATHMVTLGDEGWAPSAGDGSYAYTTAEGVDFAANLKIATLDYGTFHMYPDQWGYNSTLEAFGNEWLQAHAVAGTAAGKPVVCEEYGTLASPKTSIASPWQATILNSTLAMDQYWQFSTALPSGNDPFDDYAYLYNTTVGSDYQVLAIQHAAAMSAKAVS